MLEANVVCVNHKKYMVEPFVVHVIFVVYMNHVCLDHVVFVVKFFFYTNQTSQFCFTRIKFLHYAYFAVQVAQQEEASPVSLYLSTLTHEPWSSVLTPKP